MAQGGDYSWFECLSELASVSVKNRKSNVHHVQCRCIWKTKTYYFMRENKCIHQLLRMGHLQATFFLQLFHQQFVWDWRQICLQSRSFAVYQNLTKMAKNKRGGKVNIFIQP